MLTHPTHDRLIALGLTGMAKALEDQRRQPDIAALAFEERIAMMIDREAIERENKRLTTRLKFACLRQSAVAEDVDMKAPRGLDKALFQRLVAGDWIDRHQNLIVIGPTGVGKSWLACALGHKACRDDRSVFYQRVPRLFDALALARGDGRHARLLKTLARVELLILDDWGLATLTHEQGRDLLEIVDDRHNRGSTIVTSQLPVDHWHETIANPTVADAILDRLVHNAHRLTLNGDSLRKAGRQNRQGLTPVRHRELLCTCRRERLSAIIGMLSAIDRNHWPPSIGIGWPPSSESARLPRDLEILNYATGGYSTYLSFFQQDLIQAIALRTQHACTAQCVYFRGIE